MKLTDGQIAEYEERGFLVFPNLVHPHEIEILRADLASCWRELRTRHPDLPIASFRFGWFFVPDYAIYDDLAESGITRDASIDPGSSGRPVASSSASFLSPLVTAPTRIGGTSS